MFLTPLFFDFMFFVQFSPVLEKYIFAFLPCFFEGYNETDDADDNQKKNDNKGIRIASRLTHYFMVLVFIENSLSLGYGQSSSL